VWSQHNKSLRIGYEHPLSPLGVSDHYLIIKQSLERAVEKQAKVTYGDTDLALVHFGDPKEKPMVIPRRDIFVLHT
jgi:hypothetical protein